MSASRNVAVTVYDPVEPTVAITGGSLVSGGWRRGNQTIAFDAKDATGISRAIVLVDGNVVREQTRGCNYTLPAPVPKRPRLGSDRDRPAARWQSRGEDRGARCRGQSPGRSTLILGRQHAAGAAEIAPGDRRPGMEITQRVHTQVDESASGIAPLTRARIAICPVAQRGISGCPMTTVDARKGSAEGLRVPRAGAWRARLWLEDAAGNGVSASGADVLLRFDDQPPSVSLARPSTDQPAQVRVVATDTRLGAWDA